MTLAFTKEGSKYVARWDSSPAAKFVLQVNRESKGYFTIYSGVDELTPIAIFTEPLDGRKDLIIEVDVPTELSLVLESSSPVTAAAYVEVE